jgi:hypothetical protein
VNSEDWTIFPLRIAFENLSNIITDGIDKLTLNLSYMNHPLLGAELSVQDIVRAQSLSRILINWAANLNISYESDLISGEPVERQFGAIGNMIRRAPRIAPFLEASLAPRGTMIFFDRMWDEIERLE